MWFATHFAIFALIILFSFTRIQQSWTAIAPFHAITLQISTYTGEKKQMLGTNYEREEEKWLKVHI